MRESIENASRLIAPYVRRTPVLESSGSDFGLPAFSISFKLELLQHAGSFKTRGAFNNMLTRQVGTAGVAAASGGNHGAAVAYAAMRLGKPATIFIPTVSSQAKVERIRSYGARLEIIGDLYNEALAACQQYVAESGAMGIHAYDQVETLRGAGTVGLEYEQQCPQLDTLLVACGGGGLIGGIAAWYQGRVKLVSVEPEAAPTLSMAMAAGKPVEAPASGIAADSLAPKQVGDLMFPIAQRFVKECVLVSDEAIVASQKAIWDVLRLATEPGGAAAFAALLSGRYVPAPGERVGVLLCGSNTTAVHLH